MKREWLLPVQILGNKVVVNQNLGSDCPVITMITSQGEVVLTQSEFSRLVDANEKDINKQLGL